jgi:hypothetical protein
VTTSYEGLLAELGVAYRVWDVPLNSTGSFRFWLEPLVGARLYSIDLGLSIDGTNFDRSQKKTWVDGFIGARADLQFCKAFSMFARGDIGAGGSDFAWNAVVGGDLRLAKWCSLVGGYRWFDTDFQDGSGNDGFEFNITLRGPFLGVTFRF